MNPLKLCTLLIEVLAILGLFVAAALCLPFLLAYDVARGNQWKRMRMPQPEARQ